MREKSSIVAKILTVLGAFGVFVIVVAFYATSQIASINSQYTRLVHGPIEAREELMAATATIHAMASHAAQETIDNSAVEQQKDAAALASYRGRFIQFMDHAAADIPGDAADIEDLKSRTLQVIDGDCASSIQLGAAATTGADIVAAQATYLAQCAPKRQFWWTI